VRESADRDPLALPSHPRGATLRSGGRAAPLDVARQVRPAAERQIPSDQESLAGLLERWLEHDVVRGARPMKARDTSWHGH
jgi:hypothetical protein